MHPPTITISVAGELVIDIDSLPETALRQIKSALTVENEEKEKAASLNTFGWWDMPDTVTLYKIQERRGGRKVICLPRGFTASLTNGLANLGLPIQWDDQRSEAPAAPGYFRPFALRDYQLDAVLQMLQAEQGFYRAPAGCVSGDTVLRFSRAGKGFSRDISDAYKRFNGLPGGKSWDRSIPTYCRALVDGVYRQHLVEDIVYSGPKPVTQIILESGKKITCTREHGILAKGGWAPAGELVVGSVVTVNGAPKLEVDCVSCGKRFHRSARKIYPSNQPKYPNHCRGCRGRITTSPIVKQVIKDKDGYLQERCHGHPRANSHQRVYQHILVVEATIGRPVGRNEHVHHKNGIKDDNRPENLEVVTPAEHHALHQGFLKMDGGTAGRGGRIVFLPKYERVVEIRDVGVQETYDMVMQDPHNNFVANGIVVHNSGKTVTSLGMAAWVNQRTLVIVDKSNLAEQWRTRAAQFYDFPMDRDEDGKLHATLDGDRSPGKIGEDVWEERDFTVALRQTLHSRLWSLDATQWWRTWGLCFPKGVPVSTPSGPAAIQHLQVGDSVWGIDEYGQPVVTEVTALRERNHFGPMTAVNGVPMTHNHPVWSTVRGWVGACGLTGDDRVFSNATTISRQAQGRRPDMREVQASIQGASEQTVLRSIMRWELLRRSTGQPLSWREGPGDSFQSSFHWNIWNGLYSWWQRIQDGLGPLSLVGLAGVGRGIHDQNPYKAPSVVLQGRSGGSRTDACDRGRWALSHLKEDQAARHPKAIVAGISGVDGSAVFQPRGVQQHRERVVQDSSGRQVFNIETGTGNYLAGGLLVHNCIFDEGHHLSAETTGEICRRVCSRRLFGISATPSGSEMKSAVVHSLVGPIVAETSRQTLYDRKVLMRPHVEVRRGVLDVDFWPDHDARFNTGTQTWSCQVPNCKKRGAHSHRNSYASALKALVESPERNADIAARIMEDRGHYHLVPSRQKKHLDLIKKAILQAGWPKDKVWMLRGEENAKGLSQQIAEEVEQSDEAVILSTVADEGLDIPLIDRNHLVFPMRNELGVIQTVGRGERVAEGKTDSIVIDYHEPRVIVFASQYEERLRVYRMQGYDVAEVDLNTPQEETA